MSFAAGAGLLHHAGHASPTFSDEGSFIRSRVDELSRYVVEPVSLDSTRHSALLELFEVYEEHEEDGWDGIQAPRLSEGTVFHARELLRALPADIPDPEFAVEPDDGSLSIEWIGGYRQLASISLNETNRFAFTALQGGNVTQGSYDVRAGKLPTAVLETIRAVALKPNWG